MLVGIYSDLHSNWPALNQMLDTAPYVTKWICLGDSVGLFPGVNEVLDWQRKEKPIFVLGDHEEALLNPELKFTSFTANHSIQLQRKLVTPSNVSYLKGADKSKVLTIGNCSIFLAHFINEEARLEENKYSFDLKSLENSHGSYDAVFFGHTHLPLALKTKSTSFFNPGSAGFPVTKDGKASFLVFDTETKKGEHLYFDIEMNWLVKAIASCKYHQRLTTYINNGFLW